jgi:hypothetical protein
MDKMNKSIFFFIFSFLIMGLTGSLNAMRYSPYNQCGDFKLGQNDKQSNELFVFNTKNKEVGLIFIVEKLNIKIFDQNKQSFVNIKSTVATQDFSQQYIVLVYLSPEHWEKLLKNKKLEFWAQSRNGKIVVYQYEDLEALYILHKDLGLCVRIFICGEDQYKPVDKNDDLYRTMDDSPFEYVDGGVFFMDRDRTPMASTPAINTPTIIEQKEEASETT